MTTDAVQWQHPPTMGPGSTQEHKQYQQSAPLHRGDTPAPKAAIWGRSDGGVLSGAPAGDCDACGMQQPFAVRSCSTMPNSLHTCLIFACTNPIVYSHTNMQMQLMPLAPCPMQSTPPTHTAAASHLLCRAHLEGHPWPLVLPPPLTAVSGLLCCSVFTHVVLPPPMPM